MVYRVFFLKWKTVLQWSFMFSRPLKKLPSLIHLSIVVKSRNNRYPFLSFYFLLSWISGKNHSNWREICLRQDCWWDWWCLVCLTHSLVQYIVMPQCRWWLHLPAQPVQPHLPLVVNVILMYGVVWCGLHALWQHCLPPACRHRHSVDVPTILTR